MGQGLHLLISHRSRLAAGMAGRGRAARRGHRTASGAARTNAPRRLDAHHALQPAHTSDTTPASTRTHEPSSLPVLTIHTHKRRCECPPPHNDYNNALREDVLQAVAWEGGGEATDGARIFSGDRRPHRDRAWFHAHAHTHILSGGQCAALRAPQHRGNALAGTPPQHAQRI